MLLLDGIMPFTKDVLGIYYVSILMWKELIMEITWLNESRGQQTKVWQQGRRVDNGGRRVYEHLSIEKRIVKNIRVGK